MHTLPRYEQVSHIAVCAHNDFIILEVACCDEDRAVKYRRTCCVRYVREVRTVP
jgi:hypothetical protein